MDYLDVDWERFLSNNEEIRLWFDRIATDLADSYANINVLPEMASVVNGEFSKLHHVAVKLPTDCTDISSTMQTLYISFTELLTNALVYLKYTEEYIYKYSKEGSNSYLTFSEFMDKVESGELRDEFERMYKEMFEGASSYDGTIFALNIAYQNASNGSNIGCILSPIGKALKAFGQSTSITNVEIPLGWSNLTTSAGFAILLTGALSYFGDRGEWTDKDWERLGWKAAGNAITSVGWTVLAGSIGGPAGVAIATIVAIPVKYLTSYLVDKITGDEIIYSYKYNGKTYEVPGNGSGKNGTCDVILEAYDRYVGKSTVSLNGNEISAHNFYNKLLDPYDPDGVYMQHLDYLDNLYYEQNIGSGKFGSWVTVSDYREDFCAALKKLASEDLGDDDDTIRDRFFEIIENDFPDTADHIYDIYSELSDAYGFKPETFYLYAHK